MLPFLGRNLGIAQSVKKIMVNEFDYGTNTFHCSTLFINFHNNWFRELQPKKRDFQRFGKPKGEWGNSNRKQKI